MPFTAFGTAIAGSVLTAAFWNTQVRDNGDVWRGGGIAIPSQAALDLITAASASQFARTAAGGALTYPRINAAGTGWEFAAAPAAAAISLLYANSGLTSGAVAAGNLDTYALASQLTVRDTLIVVTNIVHTGSGALFNSLLYNSTDSVNLGANEGAYGNFYSAFHFLTAAPNSTVKVTDKVLTDSYTSTRATFTTAWTGAWTLAFRTSSGVNAADTVAWEWAIFKLAGQ